MEVLIGADGGVDPGTAFCIEPHTNSTTQVEYCPSWAGGRGKSATGSSGFNRSAGKWYQVDILSATASAVKIDLSQLPSGSTAPAGVRYAWGVFDCCNTGDSMLYVTGGCTAACPITSTTSLPANPFMSKIENGKCACVAPQVC